MRGGLAIVALVALATTAHADDPQATFDPFSQRNVGTEIIALGIAVDVSSLVLGLHAISLRDDARAAGCSDDLTHCPGQGLPIAESAYGAANRATMLFAVGTIAIGAGIYLRMTAPHPLSVSPTLGHDAAGAMLSGSF